MRILILALISVCITFTPATSQTLSEKDIKRLALEAILENPKIVMDAINILRDRDEANKGLSQKQAYLDNKELLVMDPNAPVLGNPNGDITIVEFFDYNCGYCKKAMPVMQALMENDNNLRVVYREFPILSAGSVFASRAALASRVQGKYLEFHEALMSAQKVDETSVIVIARKIGLDVNKLIIDMEHPAVSEHIQTSRDLADALQFTGTPSFVIGNELVGGYIPVESMAKIIISEREG